jgi:hypothetical protein
LKERPIIFNAHMVRAVLDGTKILTRRQVRSTGLYAIDAAIHGEAVAARELANLATQCPHGQPGDRLWVREAWRSAADLDKYSGSQIADLCLDAGYSVPWAPIQYEADGARRDWQHTGIPREGGPPQRGRYRHARFMPRWASRLILEVTGVRVERLQNISDEDARAEGCDPWHDLRGVPNVTVGEMAHGYRRAFRHLWDLINGDGAWDANPWVWVIEFRRTDGGT